MTRFFQIAYLENLRDAYNLLRYFYSTLNLTIEYALLAEGPLQDLIPKGYYDSNSAGDKSSSKSTYSYIFIIAGGPVSWKSKKALTITLSTLEAKYTALTEATREIQ